MHARLQCLAKCREEVCQALSLQPEDVELSMGMSGDFEQAVSLFRHTLNHQSSYLTSTLLCCLPSVITADLNIWQRQLSLACVLYTPLQSYCQEDQLCC